MKIQYALLIIMVLGGNTVTQQRAAAATEASPSHGSVISQAPKITFETKEMFPGTTYCLMVTSGENGKEIVGSISVTQGKTLIPYTLPAFEALDKTHLPPEVVALADLVKVIKAKYDLNDIVMLGDMHISVAHRGKGCAQQLIEHTCQQAFNAGAKVILLQPDPFEYEDGKQKSLHDSPDYENKRQRLIKLYQKCGFVLDHSDNVFLMYRKSLLSCPNPDCSRKIDERPKTKKQPGMIYHCGYSYRAHCSVCGDERDIRYFAE